MGRWREWRVLGAAARWAEWIVPLLVYLAVCVPIYRLHRDALTGDGVAYLRRAGYLARGDFAHFVSGYWSPLIMALAALLVRAGLDPVHAVHALNGILGVGEVVVLGLMLRRFTQAGAVARSAAMGWGGCSRRCGGCILCRRTG